MAEIAFLGLGEMGVRMAARLIAAGHKLTVWNRTPEKAARLGVDVRVAETPAAAADGAEIVIAMVRDDVAAEAVWCSEAGAFAKLGPDAIAVDCSTLSVPAARALAAAAPGQFLDAPVAGSLPQAEAGQLIFLAGGPTAALETVRPVLGAMGSAVHYAGDTGASATVKLMVNALFGAQVAAVAELIGFARRAGVDPARAVEILGATPVASPAAKGAAGAMLARAFAPAFPIDLVTKDFGLVAATAEAIGAELPLAHATGALFAQAAARGHGQDNITGIAQLFD